MAKSTGEYGGIPLRSSGAAFIADLIKAIMLRVNSPVFIAPLEFITADGGGCVT